MSNSADDAANAALLPEDQGMEDHEIPETEVVKDEVPEVETPEVEEETPEVKEEQHLIPKFRFDSAQQRARDAEAEVARLRGVMTETQEKVVEGDEDPFAALDKRHSQAIADGDLDLASSITAETRSLERKAMRVEMTNTANETQAAASEQVRVDATIQALNVQFPVLDPDSETYAQDKVDEVLALQDAFMLSGRPAAQALNEAARYVFPNVGLPPEVEVKKTDVDKNIDTANRQPPDLTKVGQDSNSLGKLEDAPDATMLSEEEFDALPEAAKKRMRGDTQ